MKWIDDVDPGDRTVDVAARTLAARLCAVVELLPLAAAAPAGDVEPVHRLRVATRRARAALRVFAPLLPRRRRRWLERRLVRIHRACGDARDLDVLAARLAERFQDTPARETAKALAERRAIAQAPIVTARDALLRDGRFETRAAELLHRMRRRASARDGSKRARDRFAAFARRRLQRAVRRTFRAAACDLRDLRALHRFRLRSKALRYTIEVLAAAFPSVLRDELYPEIEKLQDRLGAILDHDGAIQQLPELATSDASRGRVDALCAERRDARDRELAAFREFWSEDRALALRARFRAVLKEARAARR